MNKFYIQICIDFNSKCIDTNIFDNNGRNISQKLYCATEIVELTGMVRIAIGEYITNKNLCIVSETNNIKIEQKNKVLKIGT